MNHERMGLYMRVKDSRYLNKKKRLIFKKINSQMTSFMFERFVFLSQL